MQFDQLFERTKQLLDHGVPELRAHADAADAQQAGEVNSSLFVMWQSFHCRVVAVQ